MKNFGKMRAERKVKICLEMMKHFCDIVVLVSKFQKSAQKMHSQNKTQNEKESKKQRIKCNKNIPHQILQLLKPLFVF